MRTSDDELDELLKRLQEIEAEDRGRRRDPFYRRIVVNKRTHRVRFEEETEDGVVITVEGKEAAGG